MVETPSHKWAEPAPNDSWRVLRVDSQRQQFLSQRLQNLQLAECFSPFYTVQRRWSQKRTANIEKPRFPGYLFARFDWFNSRFALLDYPGILGVLCFDNSPAVIEQSEIDALRQVVLDPTAVSLPKIGIGQAVEVTCGPLTGQIGILKHVKGKFRFTINIEQMNSSISVIVSRDMIRSVR